VVLTDVFINATGLRQCKKTAPVIVERIANDIDEIVGVVRFDGWQDSTVGKKAVKKELRKVIWTKYQIKDEDLFNRAYDYIEGYY
jgi:type I restriction enzyme R subunit